MADEGVARVRVLLVTGVVGGGVGRHVRELAHDLVAAGHDVVLAAPRAVVVGFDLPATGATVREVEVGVAGPRALARAQIRLGALARGADVVHAHGMRAGAVAALAVGRSGHRVGVPSRRRGSTPLVVTSHNGPPEGRAAAWTYAALEVVVYRRADLVLGVSADLVERARARGARGAGLAVVPSAGAVPATDAERQAARQDLRTELGVPPSAAVVLTAGRLAAQKRVDRLIEAHRTLVNDPRLAAPPVLVVVGDGPLGAALREQAGRGGGGVHFLGRPSHGCSPAPTWSSPAPCGRGSRWSCRRRSPPGRRSSPPTSAARQPCWRVRGCSSPVAGALVARRSPTRSSPPSWVPSATCSPIPTPATRCPTGPAPGPRGCRPDAMRSRRR
ncbi:MAG: hypothetical protein DI571_10945 [Arsenicicoccus sp.]|nr:MAG: hypothetical protein DI571_10945 [Arsenicicoccus sp.]